MANVKRYHFFVGNQHRLWAQVVGTYTDGVLAYRYAPSEGAQTSVQGKLTSDGRTLQPADGRGFPYSLTPPRSGTGMVAQQPPADPDALVETANLPTYNLDNTLVDIGTPPIGTTPPPTPPPPGGEVEGVWSVKKERDQRAWAIEITARVTALEGGQVVTPPVVPPPPTGPVVGRYMVRFGFDGPVPARQPGSSGGERILLSSRGWATADQTHLFGTAVPPGFKFALTEIHYANKDRDPGGSSAVFFGVGKGEGIWTVRNHNPDVYFLVPPVYNEGFICDGWVQNDSESGPTNTGVRVHGWFFMPGHEPACVRGD